MTVNPEQSSPPLMWIELPEEVASEVHIASHFLSDGVSPEISRQFVADLNKTFHKHGLLGQPVRMVTDLAAINRYTINSGLVVIDPIFDPELYDLPDTIEGTFVGAEPLFLEGDQVAELMYRVDMGFHDGAQGNLSALAPAEFAQLRIGVEHPVSQRSAEVEAAQQALAGIDDITAKLNVKHLAALALGPQATGADMLVEAGTVATALLGHPVISQDLERKRAVTALTSLLIDDSLTYRIAGKEIVKRKVEDKVSIKVQGTHFVGLVHAAARDNNFELDERGHVLSFDTLNAQPVYLAADDTHLDHLIPLRYLTQFDVAEPTRPIEFRSFTYGGDPCRDWQDAFRLHYIEAIRES